MAQLLQLLRLDSVELELRATTAIEATRELAASLAGLDGARDCARLLAACESRLALGGVCLGRDITLLHARTDAVSRMMFAVGRSATGLAFDPACPTARLIFLLAAPRDAVGTYLQFVAQLSRRMRRSDVTAALLAAASKEAFLAEFNSDGL